MPWPPGGKLTSFLFLIANKECIFRITQQTLNLFQAWAGFQAECKLYPILSDLLVIDETFYSTDFWIFSKKWLVLPKTYIQKYSRLRCLLRVKCLVICFYLDWSGSILQFRQNIIKVSSKSWLLTYSSNINFIHWLCFEERELTFCNGYLSLLYFRQQDLQITLYSLSNRQVVVSTLHEKCRSTITNWQNCFSLFCFDKIILQFSIFTNS